MIPLPISSLPSHSLIRTSFPQVCIYHRRNYTLAQIIIIIKIKIKLKMMMMMIIITIKECQTRHYPSQFPSSTPRFSPSTKPPPYDYL
jgi:hypothetical protein